MQNKIMKFSFPMLATQLLAAFHVSAETLEARTTEYPREILYAEMPAEIVRDGEQFRNIADDSQLRLHLIEHHVTETKQVQLQKQQAEGSNSRFTDQLEGLSDEQQMKDDDGAGRQ